MPIGIPYHVKISGTVVIFFDNTNAPTLQLQIMYGYVLCLTLTLVKKKYLRIDVQITGISPAETRRKSKFTFKTT